MEAPTKGQALIRDAGHFAAFTQPKRFLAELVTRVHPLTAVPSPHPCGNPDAAGSSRPPAGRTLTASRRVLGDDHPDTLGSMNNLAAVPASARRVAAMA